MNNTAIQWTDYTWNPVTGCDKVSPGCRNCYAEALSRRFGRSFEIELHPERLSQVDKLPSGSRVFVNSMSDFFHEEVPLEFTLRVWEEMEKRPDVTFQILTKRPGRMREFIDYITVANGHNVPKNIWLGTSIESRLYLPRLDVLRKITASTRFVSFEPLLEDIGHFDVSGIRWVIAGGESGPYHRPMDINWVRRIRDQCRIQDVAFFFKQGSGPRPGTNRVLDGRTWDEFPDEVRL